MSSKKSKLNFWLLIFVVLAVGVTLWWYIGSTVPEIDIPTQAERESMEDRAVVEDIQKVDLGDLDAEFKAIDNDLNSL